jgi:hypothetical protein
VGVAGPGTISSLCCCCWQAPLERAAAATAADPGNVDLPPTRTPSGPVTKPSCFSPGGWPAPCWPRRLPSASGLTPVSPTSSSKQVPARLRARRADPGDLLLLVSAAQASSSTGRVSSRPSSRPMSGSSARALARSHGRRSTRVCALGRVCAVRRDRRATVS